MTQSRRLQMNQCTCSVVLFQPEFYHVSHSRKDYDEYGASIFRHNPMFGLMT